MMSSCRIVKRNVARPFLPLGTSNIHYDRRLQRDFFIAGKPMARTFSWQRY